jgi:hypothetical protein
MARSIQGEAFLSAFPGREAFVAQCERYMFNEEFPSLSQNFACASVGLWGNFPSRGGTTLPSATLVEPRTEPSMNGCGCKTRRGDEPASITVRSLTDTAAVAAAMNPRPSSLEIQTIAPVGRQVETGRFCWLCLLVAVLVVAEFGVFGGGK